MFLFKKTNKKVQLLLAKRGHQGAVYKIYFRVIIRNVCEIYSRSNNLSSMEIDRIQN